MNKWHAYWYGNWWNRKNWHKNWVREEQPAPPPDEAELRFLQDSTNRFTYYMRDDGTACLVDFHGNATETTLIVPETVDGIPVTGINWARETDTEACPYAFDPDTVILPDTVEEIGRAAFFDFPNLTTIRLPKRLVSIDSFAFANCPLTCVELPESLHTLGTGAFHNCSELTSVKLPSQMTHIPTSAFYNCASLEHITFPESLRSIGTCAFMNCTALKKLSLSDSIHSIGDHAFDGCSSLLHVALPHFLTSIESNTFSNCTLLSTVTIPRSVRGIAPTAFRNCPELTIFAGYGSRAEAYCHQHKIPFIEEA